MNNNTLLTIHASIVGIGICGAVGYACHVTKSALPLLGLIFIPTITVRDRNN